MVLCTVHYSLYREKGILNSCKDIMGGLNDYIPAIAMFGLQFIYAGIALSTRAVLLQGLSPRVYVVYRQAVATLVIAPLAYFARKSNAPCLGLRSFSLIFLTALIGVTINQNIYFEGLYLASSSIASAMANLVPAITFVIASIVGLEKLNLGSLRSIAKIVGTVSCVGGAVSMALFKGPKLLNAELIPSKSLLGWGGKDDWLLGCLCLFASCCCWSIWLILQVPVSASYPDHLSLSAWMCLMATLQSATLAFFLERDPEAWKLHSYFQLGACFYSGIIGSAVSFFVQAWCISRRGPLFSAVFSPLCTVIVTIFASIFLHEEIYTGSLIGSIGVIGGLYVVLWGKAKDLEDQSNDEEKRTDPKLQIDETKIQILVDESSGRMICKNIDDDLEKPLLSYKSTKADDTQIN